MAIVKSIGSPPITSPAYDAVARTTIVSVLVTSASFDTRSTARRLAWPLALVVSRLVGFAGSPSIRYTVDAPPTPAGCRMIEYFTMNPCAGADAEPVISTSSGTDQFALLVL